MGVSSWRRTLTFVLMTLTSFYCFIPYVTERRQRMINNNKTKLMENEGKEEIMALIKKSNALWQTDEKLVDIIR